MESVIHRKIFNRLKDRAFALDMVEQTGLIRWRDYLFVCHHQRLTTQEAVLLLGELKTLGMAKKVNKNYIKLIL